jgi:hypothetical protein
MYVGIQHWKEIQEMQSDVRSLSATIQELKNAVLPNAPPIPQRSTATALCLTDDISSLTSVPHLPVAPSCEESPSFYARDVTLKCLHSNPT